MKFLISAFLLLTDTFVRPADSDHFVRCYKFNIISLPFHQAKQICADFGGHLVSLRGELEEAMFDEMAHQHRICPSYFLGDEVHGRAWINTRSKARGQLKRNETCATASSVDGVWNSVACSDPFSYVCATATSPSNDHRPCPRCPPIKACSGHCENGWTYFNKTDAC
ncbi:unnamed protein product [Cylicocyclus nassatus]|uniref:C-type lectin domain-containing protein n=1 Tax=Cylicocyclus nassatus TaxID=53992 RepID=A0AA36GZR5_CYLNA|nr:unnamed protein product [Cylicocyclus nassatus]